MQLAIGGAALVGTIIYLVMPARSEAAPVQPSVSVSREGAIWTLQRSF